MGIPYSPVNSVRGYKNRGYRIHGDTGAHKFLFLALFTTDYSVAWNTVALWSAGRTVLLGSRSWVRVAHARDIYFLAKIDSSRSTTSNNY